MDSERLGTRVDLIGLRSPRFKALMKISLLKKMIRKINEIMIVQEEEL